MSKKQTDLFQLWNKKKDRRLSTDDPVLCENLSKTFSSSSTSSSTCKLSSPLSLISNLLSTSVIEPELILPCMLEEPSMKIEIISGNSSQPVSNDANDYHNAATSIDNVNCNKPNSTSKSRNTHVRNYLPDWETRHEAMYKTYIFDEFGNPCENFLPWLYLKDNSMHCSLCEKHGKRKNTNGKLNIWCTSDNKTFLFNKIKKHNDESDVHKQAIDAELKISFRAQPVWPETRAKEGSRQKQAIQNLMFACIHICHQYQSLNSLEPLCILFEKLDVQLIPSTLSVVNYRNNDAALCFLQHIGGYLHEELIEKVKASPVVGWMMDESTSRTVEKSCIVYVRYLEDYQPRTAFYGLLDMEGNGSAANIVETVTDIWRKDDLNPVNSCWFASDNTSTVTGIHEDVVVNLRRYLNIDYLESNTCVAHSFCLVGNQASLRIDPDTNKPVVYECVANMETVIGKIYSYFSRSCSRQYSLRNWKNFLDIPQLKFKRIYDIRWSSIRDCIKPIIGNLQPGYQALLAILQENSCDRTCTKADRDSVNELLKLVLNDEFLFLLHFHHDLHECVLGPITKLMQNNKLSYYHLMQELKEKKHLMTRWISQSTFTWGPTLASYIKDTEKGTFGAFKIQLCNRQKLAKECSEHIGRLLLELDERFSPSPIQENLAVLFDPRYLIEHKNDIDSPEYGRLSLDFLQKKYKNLIGFNSQAVQVEWETFKQSLNNFIDILPTLETEISFWQQFLSYQKSPADRFLVGNKNVLLLLGIYLISPTNSAECERGFSVANRIQTVARSRIVIPTLEVLMNVRLLLPENLTSARCQQVVERSFESWNDPEKCRRYRHMKLVLDVPSDYEREKVARSNTIKRKRTAMSSQLVHKKPKKPKAKAIKCANGCQREICRDDPNQREAIQCCHQNDDFDWVDEQECCSRWLCNGCRIKLGISTDGFWFCSDHVEMHSNEENQRQTFSSNSILNQKFNVDMDQHEKVDGRKKYLNANNLLQSSSVLDIDQLCHLIDENTFGLQTFSSGKFLSVPATQVKAFRSTRLKRLQTKTENENLRRFSVRFSLSSSLLDQFCSLSTHHRSKPRRCSSPAITLSRTKSIHSSVDEEEEEMNSSTTAAAATQSPIDTRRTAANSCNIEELTAYLDHFLYLPKSLSGAAELMYT